MDCPSLMNPDKVSDNHLEELYQATPEELKENRRLLQVQGENNPFTHTLFLDRALKKAQVRAFLSGQGPTDRRHSEFPNRLIHVPPGPRITWS